MVHYAVISASSRFNVILDILLDNGLNTFTGRKDGKTPIDLLVVDSDPRVGILRSENALRRLAELIAIFPGKRKCLTQALDKVCRFRPHAYSTWPLIGLVALLESGASFMDGANGGEATLQALLDIWREKCSEKTTGEKKLSSGWRRMRIITSLATSTKTVLAALEYIDCQDRFHHICAEPNLLLSAVDAADERLMLELLDHCPDVDKITGDGSWSPIKYACREGCTRIVLANLLERSKALNQKELGSELIREACQQGYSYVDKIEVLSELLQTGLDPHGPSAEGRTALMDAAGAGNVGMVELLLSHGSDINAVDHAGLNAGHHACIAGQLAVLSVMKDTQLDWNAKGNTIIFGKQCYNFTMLHLAASLYDD